MLPSLDFSKSSGCDLGPTRTLAELVKSLIDKDKIFFSYIGQDGLGPLNKKLIKAIVGEGEEKEKFSMCQVNTVASAFYGYTNILAGFYNHKPRFFLINGEESYLSIPKMMGFECRVVKDLGEEIPDKSIIFFSFPRHDFEFSLEKVSALVGRDLLFVFIDRRPISFEEAGNSENFAQILTNRYGKVTQLLKGKNKGTLIVDMAAILRINSYNMCLLINKMKNEEESFNFSRALEKSTRYTISSLSSISALVVDELFENPEWHKKYLDELKAYAN